MASQPETSTSSPSRSLDNYALARGQAASWRQLLPAHRLPVLVKTPLLVGLGVYLAGGRQETQGVGLTMVLSAALWAALYALNEATDLEYEEGLSVTSGARAALTILPVLLCIAAFFVRPILGLFCALMTAGQMAYCAPPLRLKRHWWAILLLSGILNPILRLECGAVWGTRAVPGLAYLTLIFLHLGATLRARGLQQARDKKLAYSVVPYGSERPGIVCTAVGLLGAYILCAQGVLPSLFALFTTFALGFAIYAWSGRVSNMARLRRGWLWFAALALIALLLLFARR